MGDRSLRGSNPSDTTLEGSNLGLVPKTVPSCSHVLGSKHVLTVLDEMQDQEQKQGYSAKVKTWLEKPEQADLVKSIKATISPNMKPEKQEQAVLTQAKNYIRNTGIKPRLRTHH